MAVRAVAVPTPACTNGKAALGFGDAACLELLACPALPVPIQPASAPASAVDKCLCGASVLFLVLLPFGMGDACTQLHHASAQEAPSPCC